MEARISASIGFPSSKPCDPLSLTEVSGIVIQFNTLLSTPLTRATNHVHKIKILERPITGLTFASTTVASQTQMEQITPKWLKVNRTSRNTPKVQALMKNLSVCERALIGAGGGGIAGAFTCVCLHPLDTIKTKMQTKAGAMGNIVSSAIMVPKELITQRTQAGAKGRCWEVVLRILEKDGVLGLYGGYSATLLRNLPAGVLNYSSFESLKAAVLRRTEQSHLEPIQCVFCGALAGAISASLTTPLDVVKTRLMTQLHGEAMNKVAAAMYSGVSATVKQILKEEGWVGLTWGMSPRVVHSACFSALGYFAFETARLAILQRYLKQKEFDEMFVSTS